MTPETRLLNALYAWVNAPDRFAREGLEQDVVAAYTVLPDDARALYPAAHAIGDRVSVAARPDEDVLPELRLPFVGDVTAVTFHEAGARYEVRHPRAGYVDVDSAFVHPAPTSPIGVPVIESPHVTGGFLLNAAAPEVQEAAMEARRVTEEDAIDRFITEELPRRRAEFVSTLPDVARDVYAAATGVTEESPGSSIADVQKTTFDPAIHGNSVPGFGPITRTSTLLIPNRVQITRHTDEHGVKTTETVDLRDPDDLHARFAEALGAEWRKLEGDKDVRHEWLAAFERAVEIAGEVWPKK